jgi:hypothetical protein
MSQRATGIQAGYPHEPLRRGVDVAQPVAAGEAKDGSQV